MAKPRGKGRDCPNFKHGGASRGAHTKEYSAWESMIRRCTMPSQQSYAGYGGRGITVCAAWRADYATFLRDVGPAPSAQHTLDRWPDVNGHYEPANVRWATPKQQANNKRANVRIEYEGRAMTVAEWADETGIKYQTLWARLFVHNWGPRRALEPRPMAERTPREAPDNRAAARAPEVK
jgi:hypothetical protein